MGPRFSDIFSRSSIELILIRNRNEWYKKKGSVAKYALLSIVHCAIFLKYVDASQNIFK